LVIKTFVEVEITLIYKMDTLTTLLRTFKAGKTG